MYAHQLNSAKIPLANVNRVVLPNTPGVYIFYRANMGPPGWVGRADSSLFESLRGAAGTFKNHYRYFKYMSCKDRDDAYQWECLFWHKNQATIDNSEARGGHHPHAPHGSTAKCPVPGCAYDSASHSASAQQTPPPVMEHAPEWHPSEEL